MLSWCTCAPRPGGGISTPSHRHQSPCHLTLMRAGHSAANDDFARDLRLQPEGIWKVWPVLGINARQQSGSACLHVRVLHTALGSEGSWTACWASTQPSLFFAHHFENNQLQHMHDAIAHDTFHSPDLAARGALLICSKCVHLTRQPHFSDECSRFPSMEIACINQHALLHGNGKAQFSHELFRRACKAGKNAHLRFVAYQLHLGHLNATSRSLDLECGSSHKSA